ncbi:MAG: hypothetical protein LC670_11555 [Flavobacteriales bacterium]|nr:hypothetical protein [Flavobacteriales bacterium]
MCRIVSLAVLFFTCASHLPAQVIEYEIDASFNSGLLFNRGSVSDILVNHSGNYLIMGMFTTNTDSPIHKAGLINPDGNFIHASNFAGSKVSNYLGAYLQYGSDLNRFSIPGGGLYNIFKFEFKKPAYSGPLSNVA